MIQVDSEIRELEEKITKLKAKKKELDGLTEAQKLAIYLHSLQCNFNHIDQCSFQYEFKNGEHDWNGHEHSRNLERAKKILSICNQHGITYDVIITVMGTLRS